MAAEHCFVDCCRERKIIKSPHKCEPRLVEQRLALDGTEELVQLVAEAACPIIVHISTNRFEFVIPAKQKHAVWIEDLECEKIGHELHRVRPAVHVVSEKEKVGRTHVNPAAPELCSKEREILVVAVKVA